MVVDYAALGGGTVMGCATSYSNGTYALRSAGFNPTLDSGMIVKINGVPTSPNTAQNYWSYWHSTRQADGSYSAWSYSSLGANAFQPGPDDAEGWRYEPTSGGYVPPSILPPKQVATTQAPPPPAPAPATTVKTTAAAKTTTAAPAGTTSAPAAPSTSASQTDSPTPSPSDSPTPSDTPADTPTSSPEASASAASGGRSGSATTSLLGGLGAIAAIGAGAGGVLWWRKRGLPGA